MFELPPLPYAYDALEPYIDEQTMHLHHDKHHATYTANFNNALKGTPLEGKTLGEIFLEVDNYPPALRNNAGGYVNHNLYWQVIGPVGTAPRPTGDLAEAIDRAFGSFEAFRDKFIAAATGQFGSGWAWLAQNEKGELVIVQCPNGGNPVTMGYVPLLGFDVWEHAYYVDYRNRRADHIAALWQIIDWKVVENRMK